ACLSIANNEAVAGHGADWLVEDQLHPAGLAARQGIGREWHRVGDIMRRAEVYVQGRPGPDGPVGGIEQGQLHVYVARRRKAAHIRDPVSALYGVSIRAAQIQGATLPGSALPRGSVLRVDAAH